MLFGRRAALPEQDVLVLPGVSYAYRIRESLRRTLGLELRNDGSLTVAVPHGLSLVEIRAFIESRRGWIEAKRKLLAENVPVRPVFETGARLPYLGSQLTLNVQHLPFVRARCRREQDLLVVRAADATAARRAVETWYRRAAEHLAAARLAHFTPLVGRAPRGFSIRAQRTRWGSCSSRGTISLNWRLVQMTAEILDYVVVHELCHLLVPNHSARFWTEVARVLPDFAERRRALRHLGRLLAF